MKLYHFSSLGHLPLIINSGGLFNGDVMAGKDGRESVKATWLSTSPIKERQGMNDTGPIALPASLQAQGLPPETTPVDKLAVRITTVIPTTDRHLRHWWTWAQGRVDPKIIDLEVEFAGSHKIAKEWYFYTKLIPLERLLIELRRDNGDFSLASEDELSRIQPHQTRWMVWPIYSDD